MSIDEAIEQEKFKARVDRIKANKRIFHNNDKDEINACNRSAEEHEQITEWLEELKAYQRQHIALCEKYCVNTIEDLYEKAIDDCIKEVEKEEKQHNHIITKDCLFWLKREFEQLKERDVK